MVTPRPKLRSTVDLVAVSAVMQARLQRSAFFLLLAVAQPAIFLALTILASERRGRLDYGHVAIGVALLAVWATTVWQAGLVLRLETWFGTLAGVVSRAPSLLAVLAAKCLGVTLQATIAIVATIAGTSLAFGRTVTIEHPLAFAAGSIAVVASAMTLGLLLSSLLLLTRSGIRIAEALIYPGFLLSGLLVPVSVLPEWARPVANGMSLYWGGRILRAAADGSAQDATAWILLAATTAAYALAAMLAFRRVMERARRVGSLDLV